MIALLFLVSCGDEGKVTISDADATQSDTDISDEDVQSEDRDVAEQDGDVVAGDSDMVHSDADSSVSDEDVQSEDRDVESGDADADVDAAEVPDEELIDCSIRPVSPTERLYPVVGEIFYQQIGLSGFSMGESALFVGPEGKVILIDAGNDSHDKVIASVIDDTVSHMNASGFPTKSTKEIDYAIITHMHADHSDGLQDLLEKLTITGKIIHRGFVDITNAAEDATVSQLCDTIQSNPGHEFALCEGPTRTGCSDWSSGFPSTGCNGLNAGDVSVDGDSGYTYIPLAGGSKVQIVAANGYIAGKSYEATNDPILTEDSNGENARSVAGVVEHGNFRLFFAGDLTGGGSSTDPVEQFYAGNIVFVSDAGSHGVDVLHAGHHGRDTSTSSLWLGALLRADGPSRNMVMGISAAHINSPHQETLTNTLANNRLAEGRIWTTTVSTGGATDPLLINANGGSILIRTAEQGKIYHIQAISDNGTIVETRSYYSAKGCEPSGH